MEQGTQPKRINDFTKLNSRAERALFHPDAKDLRRSQEDLDTWLRLVKQVYLLHLTLAERMIIRRYMQAALERRKADLLSLKSIYTGQELWAAIIFCNFNIAQDALYTFLREFYGHEDVLFSKKNITELRKLHQLRMRETMREWAD